MIKKIIIFSILMALIFPFLPNNLNRKEIRAIFRETLGVDLPKDFDVEWVTSSSYFADFFGAVDKDFVVELSDIEKFSLLKELGPEMLRSEWHVKSSFKAKGVDYFIECICENYNDFRVIVW